MDDLETSAFADATADEHPEAAPAVFGMGLLTAGWAFRGMGGVAVATAAVGGLVAGAALLLPAVRALRVCCDGDRLGDLAEVHARFARVDDRITDVENDTARRVRRVAGQVGGLNDQLRDLLGQLRR